MFYLRAHVDPIRRHFDPVAAIVDDKIVVAYGLGTSDLMRLKTYFPNLNEYGLILVDRKNIKFRFLLFKDIIVGIHPGFKEAIDGIGLTFAFDFELKDISKIGDCVSLSRWITIKDSKKLHAENLARNTSSLLRASRLETVLGARAIEVIGDLMWESNAFEPLHAINVLATASLLETDISLLRDKLRNIGADLLFMAESKNRILVRRKSNITLMDCAEFLFPSGNYFESQSSELSRTLGKSIDRLSPHFRGYLIVDDEYVDRVIEAST